MNFESNGLKVTLPLDPYQGPSYIEPTHETLEIDVIDQLSQMTVGKRFDYINPIVDGCISWRSI